MVPTNPGLNKTMGSEPDAYSAVWQNRYSGRTGQIARVADDGALPAAICGLFAVPDSCLEAGALGEKQTRWELRNWLGR